MGRHIVLHSPLDPVALAKALRGVLGGPKSKVKQGVTGQGTDQDLMLFVHRYGAQSGVLRLIATMDPEDGGTRIEGDFSLSRGLECGLILWIGFLAIFLITGIAIVRGGGALEVGVPFIAIPALLMIVPLALCWFGTRAHPDDEGRILEFLAETVGAIEA